MLHVSLVMKISEKDLMYMYIRLHSMFLNFVS